MRNKIILLMLLSIITAFSYQESYEVLAHFEDIDVIYDECIPVNYVDEDNIGDGINEKWYSIFPQAQGTNTYHYYKDTSIATQTIRYFFANENNIDKDNPCDWYTNISQELGDEIKNNYANSMEKWNNVYAYNLGNNNQISKIKLINVFEGDENNYDLIIYPRTSKAYASTTYSSNHGFNYEATLDNYNHKHYNKYIMRVNIAAFASDNVTNRAISYSRVGSHELGHVLGLDDVKPYVENNELLAANCHHEELLMGYAKDYAPDKRYTEITYKDIAGVMITMGFHTANDHKWMYTEDSNIVDPETGNIIINDGYKLICSICNGVKYTTSIPEGSVEYLSCGGNHSLTSNHMMAVASYGTKDYYKCKYCRYVAPFELNVEQSYGVREYISGNTLQHYAHSNNGLTYKILENHYSDYESNIYQQYSINDIRYSTKHIVRCGCSGVQMTKMHVFTIEDVNDGNTSTTCIDCNAVITNSGPGIVGPLNKNIWQVTDNGSYKLTNGIIILVEEDIDSYKEGTLVFKDANSEIM